MASVQSMKYYFTVSNAFTANYRTGVLFHITFVSNCYYDK